MELKQGHIVIALSVSLITMLSGGCRPSLDKMMTRADGDFGRGEYFEAAKIYREIYVKTCQRDGRRAQAAWRAGLCYDRLNMTSRAELQLKNAMRNGLDNDSLHLLLSRNLLRQGKYDEAKTEALKVGANSNLSREAQAILNSAEAGGNKGGKPANYRVAPMKIFNSPRSEYSPMIYPLDDGRLYFTSTGELSGGERSRVTGMKNGDIVVARKNERGEWQRAESVGQVNGPGDEGMVSFDPTGQTMYFTRAEQANNRREARLSIWKSKRLDGEWSQPQRVDINHDTINNYTCPAVSPDGRQLVFSSDRPGGEGGYDLWRVDLDAPDVKPYNLGKKINTRGNEKFPTFASNGCLFFSSDGLGGFGGLDIFKAKETGGFYNEMPENVGQPINSSSDDFGMTFSQDNQTGFFSSNRNDMSGHDHIYRFEVVEFKTLLQVAVVDFEGTPINEARVRIVGKDGTNRLALTDKNGDVTFEIERGVGYAVMASSKDYLNGHTTFEVESGLPEEETEVYEVEFELAPVNRAVKLDKVFFAYDSDELTEESQWGLDKLVNVLAGNPDARIEMTSHTDRHGTDEYNDDLSQRRSESVNRYLASKGIDQKRLESRGVGRRQPSRVDDETSRRYKELKKGARLDEEFVKSLSDSIAAVADSLNRRTEFIIHIK